jgi:hypothetical protein
MASGSGRAGAPRRREAAWGAKEGVCMAKVLDAYGRVKVAAVLGGAPAYTAATLMPSRPSQPRRALEHVRVPERMGFDVCE